MRVNNKLLEKIIIFVLIVICGLIIFKPKQNKEIRTYENKNQNKQFAMYIEKDDNYEIYNENSFPNIYRYHLNEEKSYCQDNKGTKLSNLITPNYDGSITVTSNKTAYCYLYFDDEFRGTGIELPKSESKGLSTEVKGGMYRYQGQATEEIDNYICFGTDDINKCKKNPNLYMYRIIGVEESGRIKVIKKEALEDTYQWWDNYNEDIKFPDSKIYEAISKGDFLENTDFIPEGWEEKIANNTWTYGDMDSAGQTAEELYKVETGQKETHWYNWADKDTQDVLSKNLTDGKIVYYTNGNGNWTDTFTGKVSLMYLHDYNYSVSDDVNCQYNPDNSDSYEICKTGWIYSGSGEWSMSRYGWGIFVGLFDGYAFSYLGYVTPDSFVGGRYVRPVFYLKNGIYFEGKGTEEEPFVIKDGKASTYIKNQTPNGLKLDAIRGDMYRFQGQQSDNVENYICFGTSDKEDCLKDTDHYMYRIIGIEAGTGRIKVIKKETLNETYQWWTNASENITFPQSLIYTAINGEDFLENKLYIPNTWYEKISDNTWLYGDMHGANVSGGAAQVASEVYLIETGQKEAMHYLPNSNTSESYKWKDKYSSKISLMNISDYYYSVSDDAICQMYNQDYTKCQTGWIHLSQNQKDYINKNEIIMARYGYYTNGEYHSHKIFSDGSNRTSSINEFGYIRPTFYLNANVNITSGTGTDSDPFIIS